MTEPIGDDDMHPPYGRWNELYHRASSVIRHGGGFPQDFIEDLVALGVPLNFKQLLMFNAQKRDSPTRAEVQSGSLQFPEGLMAIDKALIPQILGIADALQVDEKYAAVLYSESTNRQLGYNGLSLPTIAEILYNEERKYQLMLLCELLQFVVNKKNENEALVLLVKEFFEQQVGTEDLFKELLVQVHKHAESAKILLPTIAQNPQLPPSPVPTQSPLSNSFFADEVVLLSDALFYLSYAFSFNDFFLAKSLDLLFELTIKLQQQPMEEDRQRDFYLEAPEAVYNPVVFHAASAVFTTIVRMLFRGDEAPNGLDQVLGAHPHSYTGPILISHPSTSPLRIDALLKLNSHFMQFLDTYQPVSFHCGVLFSYLVFLDRNNPTLCRENLTKIAMGLMSEPQAVDTMLTILSEDAMFFMAQLLRKDPIVPEHDITHIEGVLFYQLVGLFMKKSHYSRLYNPQTAKPRAFFALFKFFAAALKACPDMAVYFWDTHYSYSTSLSTCVERNLLTHEKFGEKIWLSYLELLAHSATAESAEQVYAFLLPGSDKPRMSSWNMMFEKMELYVNDSNPNMHSQFGMAGNHPGGQTVASIPARPLSPTDVRLWENSLSLMAAVLEHREDLRGNMGDNSTWKPIEMLFQFLMCPVPISLKAKMVSVLAAFAKSERFSGVIWEYLDLSDLVTYAPGPAPIASSGQNLALKRREGLAYELLWNESVLHEYPLTRAFLRLISELIKWPLPRALGVGRRAPGATGMQPYLSFVINEVFVKFSVRGYKDLSEMWTVAAECLAIMLSFLDNYKYSDLDSTDQYTEINGRRTLLPRAPAFLLIRQISSSDSEIFKKIVYIIEQGAETLMHKREELKYAAKFEQAVQLSLKVLISIFTHVQSASLPFNLGQHLVSGKNPCAVHLAKLVGYQSYTKIPLLAVEVLSCLTKTQYGLARVFYAHEERDKFISVLAGQLSGFDQEPTAGDGVDNIELITDQDHRTGSLKVAITRFLLENISRDKPNVAQFYLGLVSDFGEPDLSMSLCFNTILDKLSDPNTICSLEPQLAEGFYELLYRLCADTQFCGITLEYLRDQNFFYRQLTLMPIELPVSFVATTYEVFARAWLFKLVAIDVYMMANNRTYVSELLEVMFSDQNGAIDGAHEMITSHRSAVHRYILQHLNVLQYTPKEQAVPHHFHSAQVYESAPRKITFRGISNVDLQTLVHLLIAERLPQNFGADGHGLTSVLRTLTDTELYNILNYCRQQNLHEDLLRGKIFFFSAWKQLIETIFYSCSAHFEPEQRQEIITELLSAILSHASAGARSTPFLSQMVTLVATLVSRLKLDKANSVSLNDYEMNGKYTLSAITLQKIFRQLLQTLSMPGSSRVLRGYLYAAILDYLTITEVPPDTASLLASQKDANSKTWFLEELANHYKRNKHDNYETIREFGFGPFLDLIATDAAGTGTDPWRAVALALLDKILRYDEKTRTDITRFLDDRGYLRALVDFENVGNKGNIAYILTTTEDIQAELLLFSGKLQFLQRIAQTVEGANLLWSNFLLDKLIQCQFIAYVPDRQESSVYPMIKERYESLLNPVLELGVAMLLMLRKNQEFVGEFAMFLDKHSEVVSQIIRERIPSESQKLITAMFYLLGQHQEILVLKSTHLLSQLKNKQTRFHAQLLQLLFQFKSKDMWPYSGGRGQNENDFTLTLDTLNNLLQYCVCLTYHGGSNNVIFSPQMKADSNNTLRGPTPDMSVLGQLASHAVTQYNSLTAEIAVLRNYARDTGSIPDDVVAEIDPLLATVYMTAEDRAFKTSDALHSRIAEKDSSALKLFSIRYYVMPADILEAVLSLIWCHLDHYILPHKTQAKYQHHQQQLYYQSYYHPANLKNNDQAGLMGGTALSDNDISQLREDARSLLYPARSSAAPLLNQISELTVNKKGSNVEVLVQKIKELIREPALVNR